MCLCQTYGALTLWAGRCGGDCSLHLICRSPGEHDGSLDRRFAVLHAGRLTYSPAMTRSALVKCAGVFALTAASSLRNRRPLRWPTAARTARPTLRLRSTAVRVPTCSHRSDG